MCLTFDPARTEPKFENHRSLSIISCRACKNVTGTSVFIAYGDNIAKVIFLQLWLDKP